MAASYCEREDVYRYGVPRGILVQPARPIAAVDTTANTLECEGHGLATDDALQVQVEPGGTIASPLSAASVYYAEPVSGSDSLLKLRATSGGSAIDLTTEGDRMALVIPSGPTIDKWIEYASRLADMAAIAHVVPLEGPYPQVIIACVARIAAFEMMDALGRGHDQLRLAAARSMEVLAKLEKGAPLRDASVTTAPANRAVYGSATSTSTETIP